MNCMLVVPVLLAVLGFCLFGFLATFEPPGFMGWRLDTWSSACFACRALLGRCLRSRAARDKAALFVTSDGELGQAARLAVPP